MRLFRFRLTGWLASWMARSLARLLACMLFLLGCFSVPWLALLCLFAFHVAFALLASLSLLRRTFLLLAIAFASWCTLLLCSREEEGKRGEWKMIQGKCSLDTSSCVPVCIQILQNQVGVWIHCVVLLCFHSIQLIRDMDRTWFRRSMPRSRPGQGPGPGAL